MLVSYYSASITDFLSQSASEIYGEISQHHRHKEEHNQRNAWLRQIEILKDQLFNFDNGYLHFEFIIPRMGKRADVVLLISGVIFVLEFKVNASTFDHYAIEQVQDYALDLKNFHKGSHEAFIVPLLVATESSTTADAPIYALDQVASPLTVGAGFLGKAVREIVSKTPALNIDHEIWISSGYQPTPTIIEAAQALYQDHDVREIARSDAGAKNLQVTNAKLAEIIERSKALKRKSICFVTGVPGAGKTLAGLNIAAKRAHDHIDEHAVFLSGNGPLVDVLREALARDQADRDGIKKSDASRHVRAFVQNIHHFRDEYIDNKSAPVEKVVVFDEAQRAWTQAQASKFMRDKRGLKDFSQSEPEFLIGVMDRHTDWCTVICLIGGGQEINTGEAGLLEWLTALKDHFRGWEIYASALLDNQHYTIDDEALTLLRTTQIERSSELHLAISMRSFRAEKLSAFVGAVLDGNTDIASRLFKQLNGRYPIWLTRDVNLAKHWLKTIARGTERFGLVASSGAHRLRAEGIHVKSSIDPSIWFLNDKSDVRSSFYLEEVATEFDVQGLELDWAGVCWDADLRRCDENWTYHAFRGTKWQSVNAAERRLYLKNAYRVLLTRARQGMVVFVPEGDDADATRPKHYYDETFEFLKTCGVPDLSSASRQR